MAENMDTNNITEKDPFSNLDTSQYEQEGTMHSKAAMTEMTEQMLIMASKVMFSGNRAEQLAGMMTGKDPVQSTERVTTLIMGKIDSEIKASGESVPPAALVSTATKVLENTTEIYKAANPGTEVTQEQMQASLALVVQNYMAKGIKNGSIDKEALQKELGDSVINGMNDEQRVYLDKQLRTINRTAILSADNQSGIQPTPQQPQQPGVLGGAV